jgi:hypothetical protein
MRVVTTQFVLWGLQGRPLTANAGDCGTCLLISTTMLARIVCVVKRVMLGFVYGLANAKRKHATEAFIERTAHSMHTHFDFMVVKTSRKPVRYIRA